jgi:hypothetical protein
MAPEDLNNVMVTYYSIKRWVRTVLPLLGPLVLTAAMCAANRATCLEPLANLVHPFQRREDNRAIAQMDFVRKNVDLYRGTYVRLQATYGTHPRWKRRRAVLWLQANYSPR